MNPEPEGKRQAGFTLVELLITIAILSIVAGIAVPAYSTYIIQANRSDAISFLSEVAGEQQRYFSENNQYATDMSELGYGDAATAISPESHYTISISRPDPTSYVLTATPVAGGRQQRDDECSAFTLSSTGIRANTGGSDNNCW